jgi:hypothetical protein
MKKFSGVLLDIVSKSFVVSLIFTLVAYFGNENSSLIELLWFIGFYGIIITIWLTVLHFFSIIAGIILKK